MYGFNRSSVILQGSTRRLGVLHRGVVVTAVHVSRERHYINSTFPDYG